MSTVIKIKVMASGAMKEVFLELQHEFEIRNENRVSISWLPTAQIINRLQNGDVVDLLLLTADKVEELISLGLIAQGTRVDLAVCGIGAAVRSGAARPDISSPMALRRALLEAESVAYSTGPSGIHLENLINKMGIAEQMLPKLIRAKAEPTGALVARGEAQLCFQQVCELLPVRGIDFLGPLPKKIQKYTTFSAGLHVKAAHANAAKALAVFMAAPEAAESIRRNGMIPC